MAIKSSIVVIGGGVTGLVAARTILERSDALVTLLEGSDRLGGKIHTEVIEGVAYEAGADSFLARDDTAVALSRDLGLDDDLVQPAVFGALIPWRGKMHRLPDGTLYGLPERPRPGLLSSWGAARARLDRVLPGGPLAGGDVAVGRFVRRRFGRQVLERMVDPLLAGTRAGSPEEMSLAAAMPQVDEIARSYRSVLKGIRAARRSAMPGPPPFLGIRGGMGRLIDALGEDVTRRAGVRTHAAVEHITEAEHLTVYLERGETIAADAVVLAVPAPDAARIAADLSPIARDELSTIVYAPVAIVTLLYDASSLTPPPDASGVLVPSAQRRTISACTWFDHKWPGAAPDGTRLLRCFVGRSIGEPGAELDDDALVAACAEDARAFGGATGNPMGHRIVRWDTGMPQYAVGHLDTVARAEKALATHRIFLAGAGYRGSGIPDCIKQGVAAAESAVAALPGMRG